MQKRRLRPKTKTLWYNLRHCSGQFFLVRDKPCLFKIITTKPLKKLIPYYINELGIYHQISRFIFKTLGFYIEKGSLSQEENVTWLRTFTLKARLLQYLNAPFNKTYFTYLVINIMIRTRRVIKQHSLN